MRKIVLFIFTILCSSHGIVAEAATFSSSYSSCTPPEANPTVVTTHLDVTDGNDGVVSLREAIAYLNTNGTDTTITFSLPAGSPTTITLYATLPQIENVTCHIDGHNNGSDGGTITLEGNGQYQIMQVLRSNLTIEAVTFTHANSSTEGGAIYCQYSTLTLRDCAFINCHSDGNGGAITCTDQPSSSTAPPAKVQIDNCLFSGNSTNIYGGAIYLSSNTNQKSAIYNCSFARNQSSSNGGALATYNTIVIADNNTFSHNKAANGGALYIRSGSGTLHAMTVMNSTFVKDSATATGGAIYLNNSSISLCNNLFSDNIAIGTANTSDIKVAGNNQLRAFNNLWTPSTTIGTIEQRNIPTGTSGSGICANEADTLIRGIRHTIYPPLRGSPAATMGVMTCRHNSPTIYTTAHWYNNTWYNNLTNNPLSNTNGYIVDTIDEIGNIRIDSNSFISIGSVQRQIHYYDTIIDCYATHLIAHGIDFPASGDYVDTLWRDIQDTIYHLHLIINANTDSLWDISTCDSYTWYGTTYTASTTTATHTFPNVTSLGCDSIARLHLTLRHSSDYTEVLTSCDSLLWHGNTYYASTSSPVFLTTNAEGCDSTVRLSLTVLHGDTTLSDTIACDNFSWMGTPYTNGDTIEMFHGLNIHNCDSINLIHLTLYNHTQTVETVHACDSFYWPKNGITYQSDTNAIVYFIDQHGCDSIFRLHLNLDTSYYTIWDTMGCNSFYWPLTGTWYLENCHRTATIRAMNGCDSTIELRLNIHRTDSTHIYDTVCRGDGINFHGIWCDSTKRYRFDTVSMMGCDSLLYLHLTVFDPKPVVADYSYNCTQHCYELTATTDAPYLYWYTLPDDTSILHNTDLGTLAIPHDTTLYIVRSDLRDTLFCPAYDTLTLMPPILPIAQMNITPPWLTEDNMTLTGTSPHEPGTTLQWYINNTFYADSVSMITFTTDNNSDTIWIMLIATNDLCSDTAVMGIPFKHDMLTIPNVFSPESHDENSTFKIEGKYITDFDITIFDRAGRKVFHTNDIHDSWDGSHNGQPCPQAAYVYLIRYRKPSAPNGLQTATGTVTLIR